MFICHIGHHHEDCCDHDRENHHHNKGVCLCENCLHDSKRWRATVCVFFLFMAWLASYFDWHSGTYKMENIFSVLLISFGWWPILINSFQSLKNKKISTDVLVSLAVVASIIIGAYKEAATVILILLLGEYLESYTERKTNSAVEELMKISPQKAKVKRGADIKEIAIEQVIVGDIVVIKPGDRVPVDGKIIEGNASLDESLITGESKIVKKNIGDMVLAGSISDDSYFEIKAVKVGENTMLGKIKHLIEQAQKDKPQIQREADKFVKYFVPIVLTVATLVYFFTGEVARAVTILIAACPCSIIIATPVSVVAGIGRGAKDGILIKGGKFLEKLGNIDTIAFDKTGTLTYGKPKVVSVQVFDDHNEKEILEIAASLESRSEHHISKAIMEYATAKGINFRSPEKSQTSKGKGVFGVLKGVKVYIGNQKLLEDNLIKIHPEIMSYIKKEEFKNHNVILVAHASHVCGAICVSDILREGSRMAIENLKELGIKNIILLTGDNRRVAGDIAGQLGIHQYFAKLLPTDKINIIKTLHKENKRVIMIGDGINDAPSLAQADVGIAMGVAGTDIALESADVVLMKDELSKISQAISLGKKAVSIIKQNLAFAVVFNLSMFILASAGILSMIGGALAHQANSILVILNAMRLLLPIKK